MYRVTRQIKAGDRVYEAGEAIENFSAWPTRDALINTGYVEIIEERMPRVTREMLASMLSMPALQSIAARVGITNTAKRTAEEITREILAL
jgi:hypothetical protein